MSKNVTTIIAGFGGSGGKILAELAGLLSSDLRWRTEASRRVYFLLCDTDIEELGDSERRINAAFGGSDVMRPHLEVVKLSAGVGVVDQAIRNRWSRLNAEERARMSRKWWTQGEEVFTARHLPADPTRGAGQCPMVSYFCAINKASELQRAVDNLVNQIDNQGHGGHADQIDLNIVTSLAGGTGRGCWSTLAFMLRRALTRRFGEIKPNGYFLDQGIFASVQKDKVRQRFRQRVNSLTGLSEVVMWANMARMDKESSSQPAYFLPNLADPGDPTRDIVEEHATVSPVQANSPIEYAQIVFEKSKSGGLSRPENYYAMVASGLYSRLSVSAIWTEEQNDLPRIGAFGSARIAVPYAAIASYLKATAGYRFCDRMRENYGDEPLLSTASLLGSLDPERLNHRSSQSGSDKEQWLGRMILEEVRKFVSRDSSLRAFKENLKDQSEDDARNALGKIVRGGGAVVVEQVLSGVLKEYHEEGRLGAGWLQRRIVDQMGMLLAKGLGRLPELVGLLDSLQSSLQRAKASLESLPSSGGGEGGAITKEELEDLFDKATGLEYFSLKPWQKFSEQEQNDLAVNAEALWIQKTTAVVVSNVIDEIDGVLGRLEQLESRVEEVEGWARAAQSNFKNQVEDDDLRRQVFTVKRRDGRGFDVQAATHQAHHRDRFVLRNLLPVFDESRLDGMCKQALDEGYAQERARSLGQFIAGYCWPELVDEKQRVAGDAYELEKQFKALVDDVVNSVNFSPKAMVENFAFNTVLEGHMAAWKSEFNRATGIELDELVRRFQDFYGVTTLEFEKDGKPRVPSVRDLLADMAGSLGNTCDPFAEIPRDLDEENEDGDQVMVILPAVRTCDKAFRDSLNARHETFNLRSPSFARGGWEEGEGWNADSTIPPSGNPFVMSAYTMKGLLGSRSGKQLPDGRDPFDRVSSMQYFRSIDADNIPQWLAWAEDPNGESVFTEVQDNIGLGFADPSVVRDPALRDLRWRPWARRADEVLKQRSFQAIDALLWGLVGHQGQDTSAEDQRLIENFLGAIETHGLLDKGWIFPMVSFERSKFRFTRNPVRLDGGDSTSNLLVRRNRPVAPATVTKIFEMLSDPEQASAVTAVLEEKRQFMENEAPEFGIGAVHFKALDRALEAFLEDLLDQLPGKAGAHKEEFQTLLERLLSRHRENMRSR